MAVETSIHTFVIFTGTGPILTVFTYPDIRDERLVHKLRDKGVDNFIAYDVDRAMVEARYPHTYHNIVEDLRGTEDIRVLDFNGHQIMANFRLEEFGEPVKFRRGPPAFETLHQPTEPADVDQVLPFDVATASVRRQWRRILCPTDYSAPSAGALRLAGALASEFRSLLYVAHVLDQPTPTNMMELSPGPVHDIEKREIAVAEYTREHVHRVLGETELTWEPLTATGQVTDELGRMIHEHEVDLTVIATHGRSGLRRLLLGSVTSRLIQQLSCPMLVVRSTAQDVADAHGMRLRRILVGCDFSVDSLLALQYGLSLAQEFEAQLELAHVIEPAAYDGLIYGRGVDTPGFTPVETDRLKQRLHEQVPDEARSWCTVRAHLLAGLAHDELAKHAAMHDADLIVVGARGRGRMESFLVGSTTIRLIRTTPCPVLAVRLPEAGE
jgi:nucleotide-binding universal stress UspA family protein